MLTLHRRKLPTVRLSGEHRSLQPDEQDKDGHATLPEKQMVDNYVVAGVKDIAAWVQALRIATDLEVSDNGDIDPSVQLDGYRDGKLVWKLCPYRMVTITNTPSLACECLKGDSCSSCQP